MCGQPLVSIVLPTYNGSRYLAEAVESVIAQSYTNWELIIVDDASTDRTPEIIAAYAAKDARIHTVRHPSNRRLPGALNTGFEAARGEYLTWTSDDNLYRPAAIADMVAFLQSHAEVGLVYADCSAIDDRGRTAGMFYTAEPEFLPFGNPVGACFLYPSRVRDQVGKYADDLFLVEDYDYWLRIARSFKVARLPKDLYLYRAHDQSLSSRRRKAVNRAHGIALMRNLPGIPWIDNATRAKAYFKLAMRCLMARDGVGVLVNSWRSARVSPVGCVAAVLGSVFDQVASGRSGGIIATLGRVRAPTAATGDRLTRN